MKRIPLSIAGLLFACYLGYLLLGKRATDHELDTYLGYVNEAALSFEADRLGWIFVAFEAQVLKVKTNKNVGSDAIDAKLACSQPAVQGAKVLKIEISQAMTGEVRSLISCAFPSV
ncbi:hypothetical protein [Ahniella affigens]|nr:hypothetical protein [Ahniella affigens]